MYTFPGSSDTLIAAIAKDRGCGCLDGKTGKPLCCDLETGRGESLTTMQRETIYQQARFAGGIESSGRYLRMQMAGCVWFSAALLFFLSLCVAGVAQAHRLGESYIYLDVSDAALTGRFEITLDDLNKVFPLDTNRDGDITTQEFLHQSTAVQNYLATRLTFYHENQPHPVIVTRSEVRDYRVANFALVYFQVPSLGPVPLQLETEYQYLLDGFEPTHRGLLVIENNPRTETVDNESQVALIFGPGAERQDLSLNGTPWQKVMYAFIKHGVWHIWIGFDHILFIISLLLPSVMILRAGGWQPVSDFKSAFLFVVKVVTLFTIAHSVTLSLSALGIISLPVRLVEAVIAVSIIIVALNNIYPVFNRWIWLVVFGFGLFHGLGFANVLAPLGAERSSLLTALIGFNVGVEIGQLAIIAVVFPLFFMLRNWRSYQYQVLGLGSAALILVSSFWLVERVFDL